MKKVFFSPSMEIVYINAFDIIATSGDFIISSDEAFETDDNGDFML